MVEVECVRAVSNILHECVMWSTHSSRCQKTGTTARTLAHLCECLCACVRERYAYPHIRCYIFILHLHDFDVAVPVLSLLFLQPPT